MYKSIIIFFLGIMIGALVLSVFQGGLLPLPEKDITVTISSEKSVQKMPAQVSEKVAKILKDSEVQKTLDRLEKNTGKYRQDGAIFMNRERQLPMQSEKDYYSEWTVETPGSSDRGPRRIIEGKGGEIYYTDDHYRSFTRVR